MEILFTIVIFFCIYIYNKKNVLKIDARKEVYTNLSKIKKHVAYSQRLNKLCISYNILALQSIYNTIQIAICVRVGKHDAFLFFSEFSHIWTPAIGHAACPPQHDLVFDA